MKQRYIVFLFTFFITINTYAQGSWQMLLNLGANSRIDDLTFINDSVGYFGHVSNTSFDSTAIYKTSDGGNNWVQLTNVPSGYIRSIEFINDSIGYYGLLYQGTAGGCYKTIDGGYNWNPMPQMQMQTTDGICGIAHYGNSVIAVGTYSGPSWYYRTDDLGSTWIKVNLDSLATGLVDCFMINHDTILVSGMADPGNQNKATILKSFDGGLSWQRVFLSSCPSTYGWKMFIRENGLGLASVEGCPVIARTVDYGTTWTEINVTSNTTDLGAICLLNDTLGWVSDQWGIQTFETQDGGLTWAGILPSITNGDRMVVLDSITAVCAGNGIYKYIYGTIGIQDLPLPIKNVHTLNIYPNPASQNIHIEAIANKNTYGLLDILDEKGLIVRQITRQLFIKGTTTFNIPVAGLAEGNYKLLWRTNEHFLIESFVVIK